MLRLNNLTMTVNSISLNRIIFMRSEKVIAGTPSIVVAFTSPLSNSKSLLLPSVGTVQSGPESPVKPPKSLSFHDKVGFGSGSPSIEMYSSTKLSLNLTFLVFRSLSG
ncbi:hypothetical protein ES288_A10G210400v1 [Gossypium darwinii]|uniref:Uncharacterized protein n=2 Tax=Gossypium TaxID=3633 RepID=A0A5D2NXV2_GOSTO|nr:hypothetical protein ES288_A10G210400v1 [Gossypium darwinii]TYI07170.1 hypothetical protein ES332_A10G208700v1 [Gossypium tomentosum]